MIKFPKAVEKSVGFVEDELTTLQSKEDDDDNAPVPKVRVYDDGTVRIGEKGMIHTFFSFFYPQNGRIDS